MIELILSILIFLAFIICAQILAAGFTKKWYSKVKKVADGFSRDDPEFREVFKEELLSNQTIIKRKQKLGRLTDIIGGVEFTFFFLLTLYFITTHPHDLFPDVLKFIGGWFGIKALGNYQQWSGANFGRAYFYIFALGTLINIALAVVGSILLSVLLEMQF